MFRQTEIDLGVVGAGNKQKIIFDYEGDLEVSSMVATCGCTDPEWDRENKSIKVIYTPQEMPFHLLNQNKLTYKVNKSITVNTNKGVFVLKFTAEIPR